MRTPPPILDLCSSLHAVPDKQISNIKIWEKENRDFFSSSHAVVGKNNKNPNPWTRETTFKTYQGEKVEKVENL